MKKNNIRPIKLHNLSDTERTKIWNIIFYTKKYHYKKYKPDMVYIKLSNSIYSQNRVNQYIYNMNYDECTCIQNKILKDEIYYGDVKTITYFLKKSNKLEEKIYTKFKDFVINILKK